ncbi:MAG TPA: P-loop NTPase fold protein [Spirochaetota bacterium]|nr:P-loop NTPase fold protein [Spirochaetota bacterium]
MRLNPPIFDIPADKPYAYDKFKRQDFGNELYNLFKDLEDSNVIALDAKWGEGKSTFIKMWIADLKLKGVSCIYYDAFENDIHEDPFISFSAEILSFAKKNCATDEHLKNMFITTATSVGKYLLTTGVKIGTKALSGGIIDASSINALNNIKDDLTEESGNLVFNYIKNKIDSFQKEKDEVEKFKNTLKELGANIRTENKFPLVIVIDELDRCHPEFALQIIERIKHFFSVDNVSFLLVTNMEQLIRHVEVVYGIGSINANQYLDKFITLKMGLPGKTVENNDKYTNYKAYNNHLMYHHGISDFKDNINYSSLPLYMHFDFSLRDIEKSISYLTLFLLTSEQRANPETFSIFSIIKVKFPYILSKIITQSLTYDEIEKVFNYNEFRELSSYSITKDWLRFFLKLLTMTKEEISIDIDKENIKNTFRHGFIYNLDHKAIFSEIASKMNYCLE